jgi:hypothetical protein
VFWSLAIIRENDGISGRRRDRAGDRVVEVDVADHPSAAMEVENDAAGLFPWHERS